MGSCQPLRRRWGFPSTARRARRSNWRTICDSEALLVLDNVEHLLEGMDLVAKLLLAAPRVQVLATSRTQLGLQGEHCLLASGGLSYPQGQTCEVWETSQVSNYSAVQLFLPERTPDGCGAFLKPPGSCGARGGWCTSAGWLRGCRWQSCRRAWTDVLSLPDEAGSEGAGFPGGGPARPPRAAPRHGRDVRCLLAHVDGGGRRAICVPGGVRGWVYGTGGPAGGRRGCEDVAVAGPQVLCGAACGSPASAQDKLLASAYGKPCP